MTYATCHADREHVAHGLCDCCYRSTVYYADREAQQKRIAAYYARSAAELRTKRKARYGKKNLSGVVEQHEGIATVGITAPPEKERLRGRNPESGFSGSSAPPAQNLSDKSWWREEAKPRRWIIEAQQEAAA